MKLETLRDLLVEHLQDIYDAEHQAMQAMPRMVQSASSENLKRAFQMHMDETQMQISRLEQVFRALGQQPQRKTCMAMQGLVREGEEMIAHQADPDVKDAGLIAAAQRVEHYEIAGYGTVMAYARQIGQQDIINLLGQTLEEEKRTDEQLTMLAESSINVKAAQ